MARSSAQSVKRYPLTRILGTEANVRILRTLFRYGDQLSAQALVDRTGLSGSTVRAGLAALTDTGILAAAGTGYGRLYRIRADHLLAPSLNNLFQAEEEGFTAILDAIGAVAMACKPPPVAVWIYGSVARGEDGFNSDVDIAIVATETNLPGTVQTMRDGLAPVAEAMGFSPAIAGLTPEDIGRLDQQRDPWFAGVVSDALVLRGPRPEAMARYRPRVAAA